MKNHPVDSFFICIAQVVLNALQADLCPHVARKYLLLVSLQNYCFRYKYFLIVTFSMHTYFKTTFYIHTGLMLSCGN